MSKRRVVRSACNICIGGCGVLVHLDDNKVVKLAGDPESPVSKGIICPKALMAMEYLNHPDRLLHPLKRLGERGEGKWQPVSWDEALDIVSTKLGDVADSYGAESVAFIRGSYKGGYRDGYIARFANLFGSPNITSMSHLCHVPRINASTVTYGFHAIPDFDYPPAAIVFWGVNLPATYPYVYPRVKTALEHGAKFMVIDPRKTTTTDRADIWIKSRPASDLALALGMLNVIINEGLYDKAFVEQWTVGFDQLKAHVQDYSPEKVADITWVPSEIIKQAAIFYSTNKPACIQWGNGIDDGVNSFQTARAICLLRAITGNLEIPGGELQYSPPLVREFSSPALNLPEKISLDMRQRRITAGEKLLPTVFYALPQGIINAIQHADPYQIRVAYVQGCNPLLTLSNAREVYKALLKLDFLVVADMFMTPTSALADIVLPVTSYLESNGIVMAVDRPVAVSHQKVISTGECRSDYEIVRDLAHRLKLGEYFCDTEEQYLDYVLEPTGISFDELQKIGWLEGSKQYRSYLVNDFHTPSGKVELYSNQLKEWGFDPLPIYREPPETPYSNPELAKEYPLLFTTTGKHASFRHSSGRQIDRLRHEHPDPITYIHPETANKLGIADGDWVYIETKRGRIQQRAGLLPDIDSRLVVVDYAWWYPEKDSSDMYDWAKSNVNILTDDKPPFNREMGAPILRGIACKVYKA
ncbi:molybdopterin-dependent oxidoreductase [Chloroflexota bacterium]